MPKNAQTTSQLHSSHTLVSNAQNSPSQASAIHEHELPYIQAGFRKGRGTRNKITNICRIIEKAREFQKNIYFCFFDYAKAFDCVGHKKKLWKILQEMEIPDLLTCLLRNLYAGEEATVRARYETTDWFKFGKIVQQGGVLSSCLLILCRLHHAKCWAG